MKALVLYSSKTGRTKKLAEAVRSVLPANTDFLPMEQAPERFDDYDIVFVGVWFLNLKLDEKSRAVLPFLKAKKAAIFATMHRDLFSDDISKNLRQAVELLPQGVWVAGTHVTYVDEGMAKLPLGVDELLNTESVQNFAENTYSRLENDPAA
ncbi:flavodoxin family protein [uncultured Megasphaera sp.]|uniref:flavodoxin family protein n=1 Tax=uncultured Megasphaera sp. TaxID=165188 RepID=UPI0025ECFECA|nr:flavodoxin family protein [uncultured Megasphaera sp.]